jgi:hypothetical protein
VSEEPHEYADRAEMLLLLAGEPSTPAEKIAAAQAWAIIGLVRHQATPRVPLATEGKITNELRRLTRIYLGHSTDSEIVRLFVDAERDQPLWFETSRKIQGIKAVRQASGCGLKEAKDMVEAVEQRFW